MKNITEALIKFHQSCKPITLDSSVKYGATNFKYASLGHILDTIKPELLKNGLILTQTATPDGSEMITSIQHISGEVIESRVPMARDTSTGHSGPQAQGSALTYARRYGIVTALCLVADTDDDGQAASTQQAAPKPVPLDEDAPKAWLNRTNKDGSVTDQWQRFIKKLAEDPGTLAATKRIFKLNKTDEGLIVGDVEQYREGGVVKP